MQKLCKFEGLFRPESQCKCHKGSSLREHLFKETCFMIIIRKEEILEKICHKIMTILHVDIDKRFCKFFVNVVRRS